jgi:peptide/nickel transport system ATP-binding protein
VVAEIADEVCVMLRGKVVETGPVDRIFHAPQHPYTRRLIHSARKLETRAPQKEGFRPAAGPPLLIVQGLSKRYVRTSGFVRRRETVVDALKNVSLTLQRGESLGVVGESGSGKTTLGRCLLRMVEPTGGVVGYRPETGEPIEVTALDRTGLRRTIYRDMRMIFQDPFASLNPRMTVAQVIGEPLHNLGWKRSAIEARVAELLTDVGLRTDMLDRYPHAFSGGQRQRIGIARALAPNPRLIIADEATAALDVSIRSQVLDLLLDLQGKLGLSFVFISHDISVIRYFCDRVAVMYQGEVVEQGETQQVCEDPQHPYTKALLSAVPRPDPRRRTMGQRHRYADALRG